MRIASNTVNDSIVRQIQNLGTSQAKLQNQVATGLRISQPEDDPAAVGRVINLESEQRQLTQYQANAKRALEISQASYSGLQSLKKVSNRATEIGTLGAGAIGESSAKAYASEVNQLIEQTVQFANTRFGNDYLFAGTAVSTAPYAATRDAAGQITAVAYAGNAQRAGIPISEAATISPGTDVTINQGVGDFLNHLISLRDSLAANNPVAVSASQTNLLASEDILVSALAEHGGIQTRIEAAQSQLADRDLSLQSLVSSETEADLPATIVKLNQTQTAYQAALQSAANIMKVSLLDYLR